MTQFVIMGMKGDGTIIEKQVQHDATELEVRFSFSFVIASRVTRSLQLRNLQLVAVSDNIALLTRVTKLHVRLSAFSCRFFDAVSASSTSTPSPRSLWEY